MVETWAAGDAQSVWFPEMIERLRAQWHPGISCDSIIELRDQLDAQLQRIRSERHIRCPILKCPCCGQVAEGAEPPRQRSSHDPIAWSIRDRFCRTKKRREKRWAAHRKQQGLDLNGKGIDAPRAADPAQKYT
jgi:hypothetical protein